MSKPKFKIKASSLLPEYFAFAKDVNGNSIIFKVKPLREFIIYGETFFIHKGALAHKGRYMATHKKTGCFASEAPDPVTAEANCKVRLDFYKKNIKQALINQTERLNQFLKGEI